MKKLPVLIAVFCVLFTSCKKNDQEQPAVARESIALLKKVTITSPSDPFKGQPIAEFSYEGTMLTRLTLHNYGFFTDVEIHDFKYDDNKRLIGSMITHTRPSSTYDARSVISYNGNNISNIKFYSGENYLNADINIVYQDGKIAEWADGNKHKTTFTYDAKGNNTKQVYTDYQNLVPGGIVSNYEYHGFDTKTSVAFATPYWIYFRSNIKASFLAFANCKSNAIQLNGETYAYLYNDMGYPSDITWTDPRYQYPLSYKYEYIKTE